MAPGCAVRNPNGIDFAPGSRPAPALPGSPGTVLLLKPYKRKEPSRRWNLWWTTTEEPEPHASRREAGEKRKSSSQLLGCLALFIDLGIGKLRERLIGLFFFGQGLL